MIRKIVALSVILLFASTTVFAKESARSFDFNASSEFHQLTDKISMRFETSSQFTVIQWNLKAGAKLLPMHSHLNEQVTRVLQGDVEVRSEDNVYTLHPGDVMIFPPYVSHGFIALTDAVLYEQQTPIRQDFLQEGFIEKLKQYLKQENP